MQFPGGRAGARNVKTRIRSLAEPSLLFFEKESHVRGIVIFCDKTSYATMNLASQRHAISMTLWRTSPTLFRGKIGRSA